MGYDDTAMIADRWMLESRRLVNWGSYDGYHEFRPSMDGAMPVTLLAGASESGKSTLVDAQISLLYPTGTPFNKASNSGRSERSDYTYLRGMVGVGDTGVGDEPIYLRGRGEDGAPRPVWGAIVDTYVNHTDGRTMSCAKFLYLMAGDGRGDVRRQYAVWDRPIDPRLMDALRDTPFTPGQIRATYPGCLTFPNADAFHERIWADMGLSADACRLLARIQSADAPSRLDDIFKQGVLGIPDALAKARDLVADYERYDTNFRSIDDKMRRIGRLETIRDTYDAYATALAAARTLEPADPTTDEGSRAIRRHALHRMRDEVERRLPEERREQERRAADERRAALRCETLQTRIDGVRDRIRGLDTGLERLDERLSAARRTLDDVTAKARRLADLHEAAGRPMPEDAQAWEQARIDAVQSRVDHRRLRDDLDARRDEAAAHRADTKRALDSLERDYTLQSEARTRITSQMDETRTMLCHATGLDASDLPYVAELMDVRDGEEHWRLAMNVTYAPIAQTILVDRRHEPGFAAKVSRIDPTLMARRTWRFVDVTADTHADAHADDATCAAGVWMSSKLRFRDDSPFTPWLRERTRSPRHDALCVERIDDTDHTHRQVQPDGQAKSDRRGEHGVKDRRQIIGFVTETYLADLRDRINEARAADETALAAFDETKRALERLDAQDALAREIAYTDWTDIDETGVRDTIATLEHDIAQIRDNPQIAELETLRDSLEHERDQAQRDRYDASHDTEQAAEIIAAANQWLTDHTQTDPSHDDTPLGPDITRILDESYEHGFTALADDMRARMIVGAGDRPDTTPFTERVIDGMRRDMTTRVNQLAKDRETARRTVETAMNEYIDRYAADDDSLAASVADHRYYMDELAQLTRLTAVTSGPGEYRRCLDGLYRAFLTLNHAIGQDARRIGDQLERINRMLVGQSFGPRHGTLSIHADIRRPDRTFATQLQRAIDRLTAWRTGGDKDDLQESKRTFAACATMIGLLRDQLAQVRDTGGIRDYGAHDLDPRCRSAFHATVHHENGPDERITSTGGRSGGALQELTSFVYGAALIYLLGGGMERRLRPSYTTLFLDEALIKADGRYTQRALSVLPRLGFQVIVSAPESKTGEILAIATKAYVTWKNPDTGRTSLREAELAPADEPDETDTPDETGRTDIVTDTSTADPTAEPTDTPNRPDPQPEPSAPDRPDATA